MTTFTQMEQAFREAKAELHRGDQLATTIAEMLKGRLRCVRDHSTLSRLKRELESYNARTGRWKDLH
jgi:hypothetical protein